MTCYRHKDIAIAPDGVTRLVCVSVDLLPTGVHKCTNCFFQTAKLNELPPKPAYYVRWCEDKGLNGYDCYMQFFVPEAFLPQFLKRIGKTEL